MNRMTEGQAFRMTSWMYVQINLFALVILLLIYLSLRNRLSVRIPDQRLFSLLLLLNAIMLILDSGMWLLDGRAGPAVNHIYWIVTLLYYILNPAVCMVWSLYADYSIRRSSRRIRRLLLPMHIPLIFNAALSVASLPGHFLFYIDTANLYHRGSWFWVMAAISFLYLIHTQIFILVNHKRISKDYFFPILIFSIPPILGGIIQSLIYGLSLIWTSMTISILIIFINIQYHYLYIDHLTGLFNRRQLDYYLRNILINFSHGYIGGIMIDLDGFKAINDEFGHQTGDQALEQTAALLKKTFRNSDFISRYGGDEFLIIMEIHDPAELVQAIERLNGTIEAFNSQNSAPYAIRLSIGYDCVSCKNKISADQFLERIDQLMYKNKPPRADRTLAV